jgi:hypothetical protein
VSQQKNHTYQTFFKLEMKKMLLERGIKSINDLNKSEKSKFMSEVRKQVDKSWQIDNDIILKITANMLRGMIMNEVKNKITDIENKNNLNEEILPALIEHFNNKKNND